MGKEISYWYPRLARLVGSRSLELPDGETDEYVRVYREKHSAEEWTSPALRGLVGGEFNHYRGMIADHLRWGYLSSLWCAVMTQEACREAGSFDPDLRSAEDYGYLARIWRRYPANLLAIAGCSKHKEPAEVHLATGRLGLEFRKNLLAEFDRLFWTGEEPDRELRLLRAYKQFDAANEALWQGNRVAALHYLNAAINMHPSFRRARWLRMLARVLPGPLLRCAYRLLARIEQC
jgi:hypothetical protein